MAARKTNIRMVCTWILAYNKSIPGLLSRKHKVVVYIPVTNRDDKLLVGAEIVRPRHIETQGMIESALHVFQETSLDRPIETMIETKDVNFREFVKQKPVKCKNAVDHAVERFLCQIVDKDVVNKFIRMKVEKLVESKDIVP